MGFLCLGNLLCNPKQNVELPWYHPVWNNGVEGILTKLILVLITLVGVAFYFLPRFVHNDVAAAVDSYLTHSVSSSVSPGHSTRPSPKPSAQRSPSSSGSPATTSPGRSATAIATIDLRSPTPATPKRLVRRQMNSPKSDAAITFDICKRESRLRSSTSESLSSTALLKPSEVVLPNATQPIIEVRTLKKCSNTLLKGLHELDPPSQSRNTSNETLTPPTNTSNETLTPPKNASNETPTPATPHQKPAGTALSPTERGVVSTTISLSSQNRIALSTLPSTVVKEATMSDEDAWAPCSDEYSHDADEAGCRATTFRWEGGGRQVYLTGSFFNWDMRVPMQRVRAAANAGRALHVVTVTLPAGRHQYKFIVDRHWRVDAAKPTVTNAVGTTNNLIHVAV